MTSITRRGQGIALTVFSSGWYAPDAVTEHPYPAARAVIDRGLADRAFPAAVVNVGGRDGVRWHQAFGRLSYADSAPPATSTHCSISRP